VAADTYCPDVRRPSVLVPVCLGFSTVLAASFPLLANASVGRRGGMGMEPAYPVVLITHLCDNRRIRPVQMGKAS
jgi:hypothetical protein